MPNSKQGRAPLLNRSMRAESWKNSHTLNTKVINAFDYQFSVRWNWKEEWSWCELDLARMRRKRECLAVVGVWEEWLEDADEREAVARAQERERHGASVVSKNQLKKWMMPSSNWRFKDNQQEEEEAVRCGISTEAEQEVEPKFGNTRTQGNQSTA